MKFTPNNPKSFMKSLETIIGLVDESYISLCEDGFRSSGIGPSRIIMYDLVYGEYNKEKGELVGFNSKDLDKILRRIRNPDSFEFIYDNNKIIIKVKENGFKRTFRLKETSVEYSPLPFDSLLDLPYSIIIKEDVSIMETLVKDTMVYTDFIFFDVSGKTIKCSASSVVGSVEVTRDMNAEIISDKDFGVEYSADFLNNIFSLLTGEINVLLGYGETQGPLPIYISQKDGEKDLKVFLGPRV